MAVTRNKMTLPMVDYGHRSIRLIAMSGQSNFQSLVKEPLVYAGWERHQKSESSKGLIRRIDRYNDPTSYHTIGPLCKRLVATAVTESPKDLGDACLYFFDKMRYIGDVLTSKEASDFYTILYPFFQKFEEWNTKRSTEDFERKLENLSTDDLKQAARPVQLGRYKIKVKLEKEASDLFKRISIANKQDDVPRCQKLISNYLIKFADSGANRDQVESLIDAFNKKSGTFRDELNESIAIVLYYEILAGIQENDLRRTIQGIRKYAFIFQGNPNIKHYLEIDRLEKKLYAMIDQKDLWSALTDGSEDEAN